MNWIRRLFKDEDGAVIVIVALALVVLLGCMAMVVDAGVMYVNRSNMQNVADAAALAGAQDLPNATGATTTAGNYAQLNGVLTANTTINTPYGGDSTKIEVICTRNVPYLFAKVLGFNDADVTARAVAQRKGQWAGEALPFINLAFDYSITDPTAWTMVGSGIKGTIYDFYTRNEDTDDPYFEIEWSDGITIKPGFSNGIDGLDKSKLKDGLARILTKEDMGVKIVYIFSLRSDIIQGRTFKVTTKQNKVKTVSLDNIEDLKEGDTIHPDQLVLIQCRFDDCKWSNHHDIEVTFLGNVFDLGNDDPNNPLPDFPTEGLSSGGTSILVE